MRSLSAIVLSPCSLPGLCRRGFKILVCMHKNRGLRSSPATKATVYTWSKPLLVSPLLKRLIEFSRMRVTGTSISIGPLSVIAQEELPLNRAVTNASGVAARGPVLCVKVAIHSNVSVVEGADLQAAQDTAGA